MRRRVTPGRPHSLDDGLGVRTVEIVGRTQVEILDLAPALASLPAFEEAVRSRAAQYERLGLSSLARVTEINRVDASLRIVSEMPTGVRLTHLIPSLDTPGGRISESGLLELSSLVINAVAEVHARQGAFAHGTISPAHVLLSNDGRIVLTDWVFGSALEVLQRNREQLWKEFGLAMPPSASLSRFDQQSDVAQMGALVLAIALHRPLRASEYPQQVPDLIAVASEWPAVAGMPGSASALRMWFQEALQTHPRLAFRSAQDAQRSFSEIISTPGRRLPGAMALQMLLNAVCVSR